MKANKRARRGGRTKPVDRPRMPITLMVRMFLLGAVAIAASGYAIYRHYFVPRPSMLMPVPADASPSAEPLPSGLIPVPELVPLPAPSP